MIQEKTIVCGTKDELMDYLTKKYNFVKRTIETDAIEEEVNYDGIDGVVPPSTSGSIREQLDSFKTTGMLVWVKKSKTDNSNGYPEVILSIETLWVLVRDSNNISCPKCKRGPMDCLCECPTRIVDSVSMPITEKGIIDKPIIQTK